MRQWSWLQMIAQLNPASLSKVVNGPDGSSPGVTGCSFAVRPGSYDHNRSKLYADLTGQPAEKRLPIWDFVVHRADGSAIRLHPEWSKPKFPSFAAEGHNEEVAPPRSGFDKSMGAGTFKHYKAISTVEVMRFQT